MKVLFVHDHRFLLHDGKVFSSGSFSADKWERYLSAFEELEVLCREGKAPDGDISCDGQLASAENVRFTFLPNLSSLRSMFTARGHSLRMIRNILESADACIVRLPSELGLAAAKVAVELQKPLAVEVAGCPWNNMKSHGSIKAWAYAPVAALRTKRAVAKADYALYVTQEFLQKRYPARAARRTISCSNVTVKSSSKDVLHRRIERIDRADRPVRFGLIGSLSSRIKGIQVALRAFHLCRGDLPRFEFRVLGPGPAGAWKESAAKLGLDDVVFFDGALPAGESVLNWLRDIDIYLQPSLAEGLPRALIEAMSQACPAIASSCGGVPELLLPEDLLAPADAKGLANMLTKRVVDRDWQKRAASRNWQLSQRYAETVLESRRADFWRDFSRFSKEYDGHVSRA